jgi:hypothetical protein
MVYAATTAMQRHGKHASTTIQGPCFLGGPCRGVILKAVWATVQLRVQLRDIRRTVSKWARKAEESSLLEVVVRERLLNTQQAGKSLSVCFSNLWNVEISSGTVIKRSSNGVYNWSIIPLTNLYPVYFHTPKYVPIPISTPWSDTLVAA